MARTTSSLVQGILLRDFDSVDAPSLTPFIDAASLVVDRVSTCATDKGITLTSGELEMIERWLAAHYYTRSDTAYSSRSTLKASGSFQGQTGKGLEASYYGQTAMEVDYSGCLKAIGLRQVASGYWLGKPPSTQTDYLDRD